MYLKQFSPRKRRCFLASALYSARFSVFSAQAEVFLQGHVRQSRDNSFLRASGGVSIPLKEIQFQMKFSPRKRRCFRNHDDVERERGVFSAQAEVFREFCGNVFVNMGFLRASGGVSSCRFIFRREPTFSPRKRRCFQKTAPFAEVAFVFSAQAEVFPSMIITLLATLCFLRASGGVSLKCWANCQGRKFSPRKRRCF